MPRSPSASSSVTRTNPDMSDLDKSTNVTEGPVGKTIIKNHTVEDKAELDNLAENQFLAGTALNRPPTKVSIAHQGPTREYPNEVNGTQPPNPNGSVPPRPLPLGRAPTSGSSRPYSAFSSSTKWFIVSLSGLAGVFSPISSNIFVPAIPTPADAFDRSQQDISLAVTIYLIFQAFTPSIFGAMSDSFGRRPVYVGTLGVYMGANIGLALCLTSAYWLLLFLRALQSTGGSAVISIGAGIVTDIAEPRERGKFFSIFQMGAMLGPAFGPLLGGIFAQTLGWRAIFWFLVIACGVVLIPVAFFLPETLRSLVGDGSIPPPAICMSAIGYMHQKKAEKELKEKGQMQEVVERPPKKSTDTQHKPWSAVMILFVPEIFLSFVFVSLLYLEFYCILTVFSTALKDSYGLDDLKIGLSYLPNGFGTLAASLLNGRQLDWYYRQEEKRVGGDYRKKGDEFRIELTRFRCLIPYGILFLVALTAQGWCLETKAPLAATLVVGFFIGLGSGTINTATLYGQDLMPGQGGAVSASLNLVRCVFGAIGTAVIQLLYEAIGPGWTITLLTGICIAGIPIILIVVRYASAWRARRLDKKERKRKEKEERAKNQESRI